MIVAVPKETYPGEQRVALMPAAVTHLVKLGYEIQIESGAGEAACRPDATYTEAGASIVAEREDLWRSADVVLQVRGPGANPDRGREDFAYLRPGQVLVGLQEPLWDPERIAELAEREVTVLALETIPRISRAQSMDVLSSMATIAGYKAVLLAANSAAKMFPMLMTAAGTLTGARVFVLGAGVAGLQAIATSRRLGAVVHGYDVRPAAAEQIKSLGAKVVEVPLGDGPTEDAGGYAREQDEDFHRRQQEHLGKVIQGSDIVITTAAVPGARSPVLVTAGMVEGMEPGSVIVDLAAERGGNCELTKSGETVRHRGVTIHGPTDLPSQLPLHSSQMFSKNLTTLIEHLTQDGRLIFDMDDEITRDTVVAHAGEVRHSRVREKLGLGEAKVAALETAS